MGHHDCKCSYKRSDKHRHKHRHSKCHKKRCIDRSLITHLPNVISNVTNGKLTGSRNIPPDPIIAAGPKSVISMVNSVLSIHRKDTMEEIFVTNDGDIFDSEPFNPSDVYIVYDEFSKRFFLLAFEAIRISPTVVITLIWVAVSKNDDPQNGDDFFKYIYVVVGDLADYPKIAIDKEAVYITTQDFIGGDFLNMEFTVAVFDKAPLVDGSSSPSEIFPAFRESFLPTVPVIEGGFFEFIFPCQPRPSQKSCSDEKNVEKVLLVRSIISETGFPIAAGDTLRVYQFKNVLTNPEVVFADVKVPKFTIDGFGTAPQPPPVIQAVNQPILELEVIHGTMISGVTANNSIWTTHGVFSDDGLDRSVARWYEIDVSRFLNENKLKLVQSGNADPGGTTNQIYPSINVNKCGDMAIQFTLVGEDQYPAVAYTGRVKSDPKGTVRLPLEVPIGGDLYYQQDFRSGRNRWGDYSGLAIDPCDHKTFWLFNMYPIAVNPGIAFKTIVTTDAPGVGPFNANPAFYSPPFDEVSGPGGLADPLGACSPLTNDLTGQIGVAQFVGACGSSTMVPNVEAAGAIATIIAGLSQAGGNPNQTKPAVAISTADGADILIAALENSPEPINITITSEKLGPLGFGSDWTTFIGAFKIDKSCSNSCKELNAPQTRNLISVGVNSAETKRVLTTFDSVSKAAKMKTIKVVVIEEVVENGKKVKKFTIVGEVTIQTGYMPGEDGQVFIKSRPKKY